MHKSGYVTIIGRPNVGKSTLLNTLMGQKLVIVSNRPQTTRNNIHTILTTKDYQIIFVDTPGIHKPRHKLGEYMVKSASEAMKGVDLVLFLTTPDDEIGRGDSLILENLKGLNKPVFMILNKVDENSHEKVASTLHMYSKAYDFKEIIPISALKKKNIDTLMDLIVDNLPEGPQYYPEEMVADVQERFVVSEIIREKALRLLKEEVPHGIAIEIISMKQNEKGAYDIEVNMLCEKESHKGIIIGNKGDMLARIKSFAREDISKMLQKKVNLNIWVKVRKEWRDNPAFLKDLGYNTKK